MIHYIKNLKIRLKLYILIGVALLGMLIISGMSFFLMGRMNDMTSDIATSWLPSVDVAREMSTTISNIRLNELEYLSTGFVPWFLGHHGFPLYSDVTSVSDSV